MLVQEVTMDTDVVVMATEVVMVTAGVTDTDTDTDMDMDTTGLVIMQVHVLLWMIQ